VFILVVNSNRVGFLIFGRAFKRLCGQLIVSRTFKIDRVGLFCK